MSKEVPKDFNCPGCGVPLNVLINEEAYRDEEPSKTRTVEAIRKTLPPEVVKDVTIVEKEATYHLVPKKFLGKPSFALIMKTVNRLHGEWVSQGKTSYWWVPKTETVEL